MHAGKVPGNYRIEGSYNRELPAVFLREIAECKKFDFNTEPRLSFDLLPLHSQGISPHGLFTG